MRTINKIWITGANGQLGTAINSLLDQREVEILNTDKDEIDITNNQEVINFGDMNRPDVIINCAAMTDVEKCEKEVEKAYKVNALGARNISISARKTGARIVHMSTDDVFDGKSNVPYNEFDTANPQTIYGKSKLAGEKFVKEFAPKHIIIRSSWIYGQGNNFVTRMLEAAKTSDTITVPENQFGSPTSAVELAKLVIYLMDTAEYGLYHASCEGVCSRYEFAKEIFRLTGQSVNLVPTKIENKNTRPPYSALDNFMLRISGIYKMISWKEALEEYLKP